jgi:hypothetical protein
LLIILLCLFPASIFKGGHFHQFKNQANVKKQKQAISPLFRRASRWLDVLIEINSNSAQLKLEQGLSLAIGKMYFSHDQ